MKTLFIASLLLTSFYAAAQQAERKLTQFTGIVLGDSLNPAPFVNVVNLSHQNRGTYTDLRGYFSFVVGEGDTIEFSSIGYKRQRIVVPKNLSQNFYSTVIQLRIDEVALPMVKIFALTPDEFKRAFIKINIPDDDLERAKKNLDQQTLTALKNMLPPDGSETSGHYFNYYNQQQYYKFTGQVPTSNLLNPFAWAQFFKLVQEGKISLRNDRER